MRRLTLGSSNVLASLQEGVTDLLSDVSNTIIGWTNNSDIMSACCEKLSAPNVHVTENDVRTLALCSNVHGIQHGLNEYNLAHLTFTQCCAKSVLLL